MSSEAAKKPKKRAKPKSTDSRSPSTRRKEGTHPTTTKPEVGKRVRVYRNGDPYHKGINVRPHCCFEHETFSRHQRFLDAISERVGLISGVKRLYTRNGTLVRSTQQLENNHEYVASSGGFMPLDYGAAYHKQQNAFVHRTRGGNDKREDSVLSLASKRSAPSRLTRSNTELRSTSRDLTVTSLNGSSTKSSTTGSTTNGTSGRSRSFAAARKNRAESKPPEKKKTTSRANSTDQTKSKPKKKKVKKADDEKKTNGKMESTKPKRKVKKTKTPEKKPKSESPETPRAANRTPPSVVVHESESRPSTRAESRFSGNRPLSRRSQRSSSPSHDRQTPTADDHRSDDSHRNESHGEETRHSETEHSDNEHRHSENEDRHSENENRKSDSDHEQNHRNETPPTHRTDHSEHEDRHSTSSRHQERRQSEHHTDNETHSGVSDETDEEHENQSRRQSHDANSKPKTDVPLEAL